MLENFFLIYGNNSFRELPENLFKVFFEIYPYLGPDQSIDRNQIEFFLKHVIAFAKDNDPIIADRRRSKLRGLRMLCLDRSENPWIKSLPDVAYEAVYRYRNGYCPKNCIEQCGPGLARIAESLEYGGNRRLKCFECHQLFFRYLLSEQVREESFASIYKRYMGLSHDCSVLKIEVIDGINHCNEVYISAENLLSESSKYPMHLQFNNYIENILGDSLESHYLYNRHMKLKQCQYCDNFFLTSKNDSRIKFCVNCSPKSKNSKEKNAEYQRQYRLKKKQEKFEARIENLMQRSGCSREEAIGYIEADSMM